MSMGQGWNDTGRGKLKNSEENLSHCHIVHKFHIDWPGFNPRPLHVALMVDKVAFLRLL
jgi:hypothetical protein